MGCGLLTVILRLNPGDAWGWVVLGNLYAKNEKDWPTAEKFLRRAVEKIRLKRFEAQQEAADRADAVSSRRKREAQEQEESRGRNDTD